MVSPKDGRKDNIVIRRQQRTEGNQRENKESTNDLHESRDGRAL